ncbi:MAG: hypothetical protein ABR575_12085 [Actinomycetota bacterium]
MALVAALVALWVAPAAHASTSCPLCDEVVGGVQDALVPVEEAVNDPVGTVTRAAEDPLGTLEAAVEQESAAAQRITTATGQALSGLVDEVVPPAPTGNDPPAGDEPSDGAGNRPPADPTPESVLPPATGTVRPGAPEAPADRRVASAGTDPGRAAALVPPSDSTSPGSDAVRRAIEALTRLAFPLALALIVVAFLLLQGRFDRADPKLALAPVDPEHDLLAFR